MICLHVFVCVVSYMAGRWCEGFSQWLIRFDIVWVVPIIEDAGDVAWHGVGGQNAVPV